MRTLTRVLTALSLLGCLAAPAMAQPPGGPPRPTTQGQPVAPAANPGPGGGAKAGPAAAPAAEVTAGKVNVAVSVVFATNAHSRVDPRLSQLTRHLSHLRYTGYELLNTESLSLAQDKPQSFQLEGGRKLTVTLLGRDDAKARLRVEIAGGSGKLLDTTLSVNRNGTFIVAGPKHKDGILVLPLTASY